MEGHYFLRENFPGEIHYNGRRFLFLPKEEILMAIGPLFGELNCKKNLIGCFSNNRNEIELARKISQLKMSDSSEGIRYFGEINLSQEQYKEIIFLHKEYQILKEKHEVLYDNSKKQMKNIETLAKEKFPGSFGQESLVEPE